jgi:hypothetical protein
MVTNISRKRNTTDLVVIILLIHFAMSYLALFYENLRYLKYTLPFIAFILSNKSLARRDSIWKQNSKKYLSVYLTFYLIIFTLFLFRQAVLDELSFRFFANIAFVLLPLLLAYTLLPSIQVANVDLYIKILSYGTVLGFILEQYDTIIPTILSISTLLTGITDSEVETESNVYSYLLAVVVLFSFYFRH